MCQGVGVSSTALARMSDLSYDEEDDRNINLQLSSSPAQQRQRDQAVL